MTYELRQNYPNPFNPITTIEFNLGQPSTVTLKVYDIIGREVATLFENEALDEGEQEIDFDVGGALAQTQLVRPDIVMSHASGRCLAQLPHVTARLPSGELFEETLVGVGLNVQDVLPTIARDLPQVRGVGVERIFDQ